MIYSAVATTNVFIFIVNHSPQKVPRTDNHTEIHELFVKEPPSSL